MSFSRAQQAKVLAAIKADTNTLHLYSTNPTSLDTGTEITGGGYTAQSISFTVPATDGTGTSMTNSNVITFPTALADWSAPVTHFAIRSSLNEIVSYGTISSLSVATSRTIKAGDVFQLGIGVVKIKLPD